MTQQERFLATYKEYETLVRATGKDPKEVETEAPDVESNRLYMCRQFRNYIAHVPDVGFIFPTENMMRFLQSKINDLKIQGDVAKKHLKKSAVCMLQETSKISEAAEMFAKLKRDSLLVQGKSGWLMLSVYDVVGQKSTMKVSALAKQIVPHFCAPLDAYVSLDFSKPIVCTDDGTKTGKVLGQVWKV